MTEKEIVQPILRNSKPRLTCLLRGTVKDVGDLVRIATQIERDFDESKRYWSQINVEEQKRNSQPSREPQHKLIITNTRVVHNVQGPVPPDIKTVAIPIVLCDRHFTAMVNTGSMLSLIQESSWRQLCKKEPYQLSKYQSFMLANGQHQTAIGKVNWLCWIQGQQVDLTLLILKDTDLTVPIILGMYFLLTTGIVLDFRKALYTLPSTEDSAEELSFPFITKDSCPTGHFCLALPPPPISDAALQTIHQLIQKADTQQQIKEKLKSLMLEWPTVCTHEIGHTNMVKHCIISTDKIPVRKRAYKVSKDKQNCIDAEVKELLARKYYSSFCVTLGITCRGSPKERRWIKTLG